MLIAVSFVLGMTTDWWFLALLGGLIGEVAHFASSSNYRHQLRSMRRAKLAAVATASLLSALCLAAFGAGRLLAEAIKTSSF